MTVAADTDVGVEVCAGVEDDEVILRVEEEEYVLPIELIDKANIIPTF